MTGSSSRTSSACMGPGDTQVNNMCNSWQFISQIFPFFLLLRHRVHCLEDYICQAPLPACSAQVDPPPFLPPLPSPHYSSPSLSDISGWDHVSFLALVTSGHFIPTPTHTHTHISLLPPFQFPLPISFSPIAPPVWVGFQHLDHIIPGCPSSLLISNLISFC